MESLLSRASAAVHKAKTMSRQVDDAVGLCSADSNSSRRLAELSVDQPLQVQNSVQECVLDQHMSQSRPDILSAASPAQSPALSSSYERIEAIADQQCILDRREGIAGASLPAAGSTNACIGDMLTSTSCRSNGPDSELQGAQTTLRQTIHGLQAAIGPAEDALAQLAENQHR